MPADFRLTVAGWGDPAYEAAVQRAAAGAQNVEFVGPLYGAAKTAALAGARFLVLPSVSEGLPMAVLEAVQHGCIPIITEQCNLPEMFRDRIAQQIKSDFSDFLTVVTHARTLPPTKLSELSNRAINYAGNYLWSKIAQAMIAQYARGIATGSCR